MKRITDWQTGKPFIRSTVMDQRPFKLNIRPASRLAEKPVALLTGFAERCIQLDQLNRVYETARQQEGPGSFVQKVLKVMNVRYDIEERDLQNLPKSGTAIVVANHPFGMIEGLVLSDILHAARPDTRILANYMLGQMPEMRDLFIFVDPFNEKHSKAANIKPMKECLRWIRNGGVLGVFPSGEVSHLNLQNRHVQDPPWTEDIARLVRHTQAPVVPLFFEGANGPLFQLAGMVHPRLRTALLPREFMNKQHSTLRVRIGKPIPFEKSSQFESDAELMEYLRLRTYMLSHRGRPSAKPRRFPRLHLKKTRMEPLAEAVPADELAREVAALPPEQTLIQADEYAVYYARTTQIPQLLREIGRLRELTFREADEGTGRALDLDRFDRHYLHLFVWNVPKGELVGAYRMGQADVIVRQSGIRGLYTSTLFKYRKKLMDQLNPALELGRSFIRPEYQRTYPPLLLLWKGIGAYVAKHPRYTSLFGPVSMSNEYHSTSRQLLVRFLEANTSDPQMARLISPRKPLPARPIRYCDQQVFQKTVTCVEDISELIQEIEKDQKSIPILLKQYLKLGGRLLAFNLDPSFSDVLDGLIWVDLRKTDQKTMLKYMGKEGYTRWQEYHSTSKTTPTPVLAEK